MGRLGAVKEGSPCYALSLLRPATDPQRQETLKSRAVRGAAAGIRKRKQGFQLEGVEAQDPARTRPNRTRYAGRRAAYRAFRDAGRNKGAAYLVPDRMTRGRGGRPIPAPHGLSHGVAPFTRPRRGPQQLICGSFIP